MTAWNTILDAVLSVDKPLTYVLARIFRDNPIAIAEGSAGSPAIVGLNPLAKVTVSGTPAAITFTDLPAVDVIEFELLGIRPATSSHTLKMQVSTNNGSIWISTSYYYAKNMVTSLAAAAQEAGEAALAWELSAQNIWPNGTTFYQGSGKVTLLNNGSVVSDKSFISQLMHSDGAGHIRVINGGGAVSSKTTAINAVKFYWDNGITSSNFAAGTITCRPRRANVTN